MTGTGYVIQDLIDLMIDLQNNYDIDITVILSKEGSAVVKWYKKWLALTEAVKKVKVEKTPNIPFYAGPLQLGNYDLFLACTECTRRVSPSQTIESSRLKRAEYPGYEIF